MRKLFCRQPSNRSVLCFNGAALFQVRKLIKIGNVHYLGIRLQWGRTFSSAETFPIRWTQNRSPLGFNGAALFQVRKRFGLFRGGALAYWLQWGRTFSSAETSQTTRPLQSATPLQWGRTFSSAETKIGCPSQAPAARASMGPHFFKCGNSSMQTKNKLHGYRFNGAALFQVRKLRNIRRI